MTITVCIDCRYLHDRPSGIAECVRALVEYLPLLAPEWRFLLLKSPRFCGPLSNATNVDEVTVRAAANGPATAWWLPRLVDLSRVDLFHAPANILPRGLAMPGVATVHDIMWLTHPHWCNPRPSGVIDRWFYASGIRHALNRSAAIATVTAATKNEITARSLAPSERIHVTRSGVAPEFRPVAQDPASLADFGLRHDARYILIVGQHAPYKNHAGALRAFAAAYGDADDIHCILIQRRQPGGPLAPLIAELGLEGRVHVSGPVDLEELVALYSRAQALLHPSLAEGFGNPLVEAMACGCPVITSDRSAMPEVTGGAALLVDPDDIQAIANALREVTEDSARAAAMRSAGLERARSFRWRDFAAANLAVYRAVLGC